MGMLLGDARGEAVHTICAGHYSGTVPSGKSHYFKFHGAYVVWSIPANKNLAKFILKGPGVVWELSRLWAPDGHAPNLLTQAISAGVKALRAVEPVDLVVSYADPNAGHRGGVYRAASWLYHGQSEESRLYRSPDGRLVSRRAFHSGRKSLTKGEILAMGYTQDKAQGKLRFVRPLTRLGRKAVL